jgi:hypothetical protein
MRKAFNEGEKPGRIKNDQVSFDPGQNRNNDIFNCGVSASLGAKPGKKEDESKRINLLVQKGGNQAVAVRRSCAAFPKTRRVVQDITLSM